ncbi:hypothetical protein [Algivirga pacifica]|uniref:Esterase n=1 Tax=Algivirga pacifica TaxID=1162670 RepID=A0ABP9DBT5_9BACT
MKQKIAIFSYSAPYLQRGDFSEEVTDIWIAFHGYGQLAKHFGRRFDVLDSTAHVVIIPQGLSMFYLDKEYKKVGASWMTKENRMQAIHNQYLYLDQIMEQISLQMQGRPYRLHLLGFSQGVATVCRWVSQRAVRFDSLALWAGKVPEELILDSFTPAQKKGKLWMVVGDEDPLAPFLAIEEQRTKVMEWGFRVEEVNFEGGHEVKRDILKKLYLSDQNK